MKISTRLSIGFAAMMALVALLGAVSMSNLMIIQHEFESVMDDRVPKLKTANELKFNNDEVSQAMSNLFIVSDPGDIKAQYEIIGDSTKRTTDAIERLARTIHGEIGKAALTGVVGIARIGVKEGPFAKW